MAQIAIKGHSTRGKEVIKILEMLGGKIQGLRPAGKETFSWYYINGNGYIDYMHYSLFHDATFFALEKFLEMFPYKVGDKVQHKGATSCGIVFEVEKMRWVDNGIEYTIKRLWHWNDHHTVTAEDLQPYKEETMEGVYAYNEINCYHQDFGDKVRIRLGNDFEIKVEDNITYIVKKQPQYPKTYEESCEVLGYEPDEDEISCYKGDLIESFVKLLICRDSYWKIAGEQMGIGRPWRPDWDTSEVKFTIVECANELVNTSDMCNKRILAFPTAEMRDAFYENFKDLIEQCKELL